MQRNDSLLTKEPLFEEMKTAKVSSNFHISAFKFLYSKPKFYLHAKNFKRSKMYALFQIQDNIEERWPAQRLFSL